MGKSSLFSTEDLRDIIHKYYSDIGNVSAKLSFTELARYARETLGIKGIQYYHFGRNKDINLMMKDFNKSLNESSVKYSGDDTSFTKLDVKNFLKNHGDDKKRLSFLLTSIQEAHQKLYDRTIDYKYQNVELTRKIETLEVDKDKYYRKYKELNDKVEDMKKVIRALRDILDLRQEQQLINALNSTGLYNIDVDFDSDETIKKLDDSNGKDIEKLLGQFADVFKK